jgi:GTPase
VRRSLVAAQGEAARGGEGSLSGNLSKAERAVLVAVEFTGERRKLTTAARVARNDAIAT